MKNNDLISQVALISNTNKTQTILSLVNAGYDFNTTIEEQDNQVDEMIAQMLLLSLTAPVNNEVEEIVEVIQEEPQQDVVEVIQEDTQVDDRELQLLSLFGEKRTQPSKRKDKVQLTELILSILIPKSSKGQIKGRIQRDQHKRNHVTQLINQSETKEQLIHDLINWIDDFKHKANKRK